MSVQPTAGEFTTLLTALGTGIVSGHYAPGQVLTLEALGVDHGVSRSVAREVIRVLESMGMVAARRRIGITVQPKFGWNVFDPKIIRWQLDCGDRAAQRASLSELRHGFEPEAAALAARRANPEQCRVMAAAVSDMVVHGRSGDLDGYLAAEKVFHRTLLEASGNDMFRALSEAFDEVLTGGTNPTTPSPTVIELHDAVARAIRNGDDAAAERDMRAIVDESTPAVSGQYSTPTDD